jgi:lysophospholipase L1-like esterase
VTSLNNICGLLPGFPVYVQTNLPATTSTDAFATTANQTVVASEAQRLALNASMRAGGVANAWGVVDTARWAESATDPGKWLPGLTADGTHPNRAGSVTIATGGALAPLGL